MAKNKDQNITIDASAVASLAAAAIAANPALSIDEAVRSATESLRRITMTQLSPKQISDSIKPDRIMCFEDGTWHILLRRYLRRKFNLSPDAYRAKWNLGENYPMTAPNYAASRAKIAKKTGLGKGSKKLK